MLCCWSKTATAVSAVNHPTTFQWNRKRSQAEYRYIFEAERSIPLNCRLKVLELRVHLEEPPLFQSLFRYAQSIDQVNLLELWGDITDFKGCDCGCIKLKYSKGLDIYEKYIGSKDPVYFRDFAISDNIARKLRIEVLRPEILDASVTAKSLTNYYGKSSSQSRNHSGASMSTSERMTLECTTRTSKYDEETRSEPLNRIIDELQLEVLSAIFDSIFQSYQRSPEYAASRQEYTSGMKNAVDVDDFEYFEKLGQGSFGFVVHCRKKSTGKHYAMKVQTKAGMLDNNENDLVRATLERDALVKCHHPFIVSMDYALQTPTLALMVMDLSLTGTLLDSLRDCPYQRMPLERVRFYAAEISLALAHIHRLGMIYRDLKPANVILCEDGHIKLVDFGGVVDVNGKVLHLGHHSSSSDIFAGSGRSASRNDFSLVLSQFTNQFQRNKSKSTQRLKSSLVGDFEVGSVSTQRSAAKVQDPAGESCVLNDSKRSQRSNSGAVSIDQGRDSVTFNSHGQAVYRVAQAPDLEANFRFANACYGTAHFMAPEVLSSGVYSRAVDYWSLGCVIFFLLTGANAFESDYFVKSLTEKFDSSGESRRTGLVSPLSESHAMGEGSGDIHGGPKLTYYEVAGIKSRLEAVAGINGDERTAIEPAISIVYAFLTASPGNRLGSGSNGVKNICSHSFFSGYSWGELCLKQSPPPFVPPTASEKKDCDDLTLPSDPCTFTDIISRCGFEPWLSFHMTEFENKFFSRWDYIAASILKLEVDAELSST